MRLMTKRIERIQYHFSENVKLKEHFSQKDSSKDHTDGPLPLLQKLKEPKLSDPVT